MLKRTVVVLSFAFALLATAIFPDLIVPGREARAQFASQGLLATSVAGTNTITMTVYNMSSLVKGVPFSFIPASTNTGPTTINVNGLGNVTTRRPSSLGLVGLSGAEIQSGVLTTVVYDGTSLNLVYPINPAPIGSILELRISAGTSGAGVTAPPGYLVEDGSCVSQTTYAALFSLIGTSYGACSGGLFALPDSRGALIAAADNQGANGSAGRITSGGSGCAATATGILCGAQNQTLTVAQLPTGITSAAVNSISVVPTGGSLGVPVTTGPGNIQVSNCGTGSAICPASTSSSWGGTGTFAGNNTINVTSTNTSGSSHPILPPLSVVVRFVKT